MESASAPTTVGLAVSATSRLVNRLAEADSSRFREAALPRRAAGSARCVVKGCVFPARAETAGFCSYHALERREPRHFISEQPSKLLLDCAKFGIALEYDNGRQRDHRLFVAERQAFLETA